MEALTPQTVAKGKSGGIMEAPRAKEAVGLDALANAAAAAKQPCETTPAQGILSSPQTATPESAESDEFLKRKLAFDEKGTPLREGRKEGYESASPDETPKPAPVRASRTTATKISSALIEKVKNNQTGFDLKITATAIPFDSLSLLCEALATNESTERLDLEGCGIGDKGCVVIRDLLVKNTQIKQLDLQMNQITDVGCRCLSEILPKNFTLQRMYLGYNDIRDDGVYALIGAMRPRGQLEVVVSGNTHVSDQALGRLDRALEQQWKPTISASKVKKDGALSSAGYVGSGSPSPRGGKRTGKGYMDDAEPSSAKKARSEREGLVASPPTGAVLRAGKARRAHDKHAAQDDEEWVPDKNLHLGAPFTFRFLDSPQASPSSTDPALGLQFERLAAKFKLQWSRLRTAAEDQLKSESRHLTVGPCPRSAFDAACRFLASRMSFTVSPPLWGPRQTELDRQDVVAGRVSALSLKLRHMAEDIVREQLAEAETHARAYAAADRGTGEMSFEREVVVVPCPFRLEVLMAVTDATADAPAPIVVF